MRGSQTFSSRTSASALIKQSAVVIEGFPRIRKLAFDVMGVRFTIGRGDLHDRAGFVVAESNVGWVAPVFSGLVNSEPFFFHAHARTAGSAPW
jgi:hypothetical protein